MAPDQVAHAVTDEATAPAITRGRGHGVLANSDFAKLFAGELVSDIGSQVTQFTMPLVAIITLNATAFQVGVLNALKFVPVIFVALFAGVWLDRGRRRPIMIMCALGNAVLIGLVPISSVAGFLSIGLLYVVITLAGTLTVIFDVGALSYVPFLVDTEQLSDGNSKLQASSAFAGIAGPGVAGFIVGLITAPITLSVDAVSYLFSAAGMIAITRYEPKPEQLKEMNATYRMVLFGALPVGAFLAGLLGSTLGLWHAILISCLALTLPMAWLAFSPVFRLKEIPTGPQSQK